jgi:hypothetical protein
MHPRLKDVLASLPRTRRPWLFVAVPSRRYPDGGHHISTKRLNEQFIRLAARLGMPTGGTQAS